MLLDASNLFSIPFLRGTLIPWATILVLPLFYLFILFSLLYVFQ